MKNLKKLLSLRNVLICIAFTVALLFIKDNLSIVNGLFSTIITAVTPFFSGFLIAYILNYPYKFFYSTVFKKMGTRHKFFEKFRKPLSIVCTYTLIFAILVFLISILVPQIAVNIVSIVNSIPSYGVSIVTAIDNLFGWVNSTFGTQLDVNAMGVELMKQLQSIEVTNITSFATGVTTNLWSMIANAGVEVYNFIMGMVISIYFLADKENLCRLVKKLAVAFFPIKWLPKIYEIVDITDSKCGRFLVGDIIDAAFLGLLTFAAMSIFQLPFAPLISVIVGVTNIIPFFGPIIGAIPSALILFLEDPKAMIWFIIIIVIIQQLDGNVFKPTIIGNQVGLSSFWVLFSVIVGGALFGVIGFILGTPVFAVIYSLIRKKADNAINDKGKIAQEALDFEVLNYVNIAAEQKRIREEKEQHQKEKLKKLIPFVKEHNEDEHNDNDDSESNSFISDVVNDKDKKNKKNK